MAVKTTKIQCNQDVDLRGKVDIGGKVTCGGDAEIDGALTLNSAKDLKTKDGSGFALKSDLAKYATKNDLNAKQSTLYRHTITITSPNGCLSMSLDTESNAKIGSINDIIAKFKGNKLACNAVSGSVESTAFYTVLTIGSTSEECTLSGRNFKGAILMRDTLAAAFGNQIIVDDSVTAM